MSKKSFEDNLQVLDTIVKRLESGDVPLEEALDLFQKGMLLSKELETTLDEAEKTLVEVVQADGSKQEMDVE